MPFLFDKTGSSLIAKTSKWELFHERGLPPTVNHVIRSFLILWYGLRKCISGNNAMCVIQVKMEHTSTLLLLMTLLAYLMIDSCGSHSVILCFIISYIIIQRWFTPSASHYNFQKLKPKTNYESTFNLIGEPIIYSLQASFGWHAILLIWSNLHCFNDMFANSQ